MILYIAVHDAKITHMNITIPFITEMYFSLQSSQAGNCPGSLWRCEKRVIKFQMQLKTD